jgi:integrator complex subunit 11
MEVKVLGAGQDVGRSCIVVTMNKKKVMFDCGLHMGFKDLRRFPDFSLLTTSGDYAHVVDCVIIRFFFQPLFQCINFAFSSLLILI